MKITEKNCFLNLLAAEEICIENNKIKTTLFAKSVLYFRNIRFNNLKLFVSFSKE